MKGVNKLSFASVCLVLLDSLPLLGPFGSGGEPCHWTCGLLQPRRDPGRGGGREGGGRPCNWYYLMTWCCTCTSGSSLAACRLSFTPEGGGEGGREGGREGGGKEGGMEGGREGRMNSHSSSASSFLCSCSLA